MPGDDREGCDKAMRRPVPEGIAGNLRNVGRVTVGGRSSVVEFQPSKLAVVGSNPIARSKFKRIRS